MGDYSLNGKVALVTGAARGIGYETARQMHMRGASVAVLDLDATQAQEAAERIGPRAIGLAGDVTDEGAMRAAVATVVEKFGGLDVAVANAGIAQKDFATVRGISGEEWERVFEVDLLGVWRTVRAALPEIVKRQGQMVVISSVYAFANGFGNTPYAVAKSGVESLGRALRVELAPHGASATVAYFGWVDTKLVQDAFAQPKAGRVRELVARVAAEAHQPRRGRRRPRPRHRGARPAGLRPQVVALRLRPARPDQPAARQADGERPQDPLPDRRSRRRNGGRRRGLRRRLTDRRLAGSPRGAARRRRAGRGRRGSPERCRLRWATAIVLAAVVDLAAGGRTQSRGAARTPGRTPTR